MNVIAGIHSLRRAHRALRLLVICLLLAACQRTPPLQVLTGSSMGTTWTVQLSGLPATTTRDDLRGEIEALLESANAQMSTYRDDSQISRFNRAPAGTVHALGADFAMVLQAALDLAAATQGAYDPTIGPLVNLWGFGPDGPRDAPPDATAVEVARARVGWQRAQFHVPAHTLLQPGGLMLDLSSIAKGHAVDMIADHLVARGVSGFLVDIGGDLRVHGLKPEGTAWRVAIERPGHGTRTVQAIIEPGDGAVATSGSYRNFFAAGGATYSHTLDPRTGTPVRHALVSVTVVHASCMQADALATALSVLGPEAGLAFARQRGLAALFLMREGEVIVERMTPMFHRLVDN